MSNRPNAALMLISQMQTELTQTRFAGANQRFGFLAKPRAIFQPPEQRMRIEQNVHQSIPIISPFSSSVHSERPGDFRRQRIVEIGVNSDQVLEPSRLPVEAF